MAKYNDWCPLCGARFEGETPEEVVDQILEHLKEGVDGKNDCERNWKSFAEALKDSHY